MQIYTFVNAYPCPQCMILQQSAQFLGSRQHRPVAAEYLVTAADCLPRSQTTAGLLNLDAFARSKDATLSRPAAHISAMVVHAARAPWLLSWTQIGGTQRWHSSNSFQPSPNHQSTTDARSGCRPRLREKEAHHLAAGIWAARLGVRSRSAT